MEELKEIDRYAASVGIELIPCIQTLAHLNSIFRWGEYKKIQDIDDILLMEDERTETLIENMFATLSEAISSASFFEFLPDQGAQISRRTGFSDSRTSFLKLCLFILITDIV